MFWALLLGTAGSLSIWQGKEQVNRLRASRPVGKHASRLDELRPPQCLNEALDISIGEHYYPVHSKAAALGGMECRFGDFVFPKKSILGAGGYGTVVVAVHKPSNRTFALKSIIEMNPAWHRWIRAEECIQYGLDFPLITKHFCTMVDDWYAWLVLELVEGDTLRRVLQKNSTQLDPQRVIAQLVLGLQYIHLNNIVIGDLTTANVMIQKDGSVKIIDFGFALRRDPGRAESPPSWNDGRALPDFSGSPYNDWYALGMCIYETMAALRPNVECRPAAAGKAEGLNPNMPVSIYRPAEEHWSNCAWIKPERLKLERCSSFLDKATCDLVEKLAGYTAADNWQQTWGLTPQSVSSIKSHAWFYGVDWAELEGAVQPFMKLSQYNS